ncbi:MAG TPA: extracellular solute-binding protein [Anaerolineae bacterium]|nr:extracellular solute-binding protein [Anaerolineae bacterium]
MEKKITRRDFIKVTGTTALGAAIAACAPSTAAPTTAPSGNATAVPPVVSKGKTITVGMETGSQFWVEFYQDRVADFTSKTGIEFKPLFAPHAEMKQRFVTEELAGSGAIDVYMLDQPWVGQFIAAKYLLPITARVDAKDKDDFLPTALATNSSKGEIYGLPFLVHNSVLYYRTDLYKEAGLTAPPKTWAEYREYAKKLTKPDQGIYGAIMEGKQGPEPAAKYLDLLQQAGGRVLDDNGKVVLNAGPALEALRFMLAIQYEDKTSPPGGPGFDNGDTHTLFLQGKLAQAPNWPYMYVLSNDPKQSKVIGKFAVALQPGLVKQAAQVFSWGWGISAHSKNPDAAWEFVNWATTSDMLAAFGKKFTNPVPRKSSLQALLNDPSITKEQLAVIQTMSDSVAASETIPVIPQWDDIQTRIGAMVSKVMSQQATPEDAVKEAQADIEKIMQG